MTECTPKLPRSDGGCIEVPPLEIKVGSLPDTKEVSAVRLSALWSCLAAMEGDRSPTPGDQGGQSTRYQRSHRRPTECPPKLPRSDGGCIEVPPLGDRSGSFVSQLNPEFKPFTRALSTPTRRPNERSHLQNGHGSRRRDPPP